MDTAAVKGPPPPTASQTIRAPAPTLEPVAETELAPSETVQPAVEAEAARPSAENNAQPIQSIKREEYRDTVTDSLVFRAIDTETGEVVRQIPEESLLRLRRAFAETTHQDMTGLGLNRSL